jgi:hypothetical protein
MLLSITLSGGMFTLFAVIGGGLCFVGGAIWMAAGRSSKEEEKKYWEELHALPDDYPEDAQLKNGNIPDYKKAK